VPDEGERLRTTMRFQKHELLNNEFLPAEGWRAVPGWLIVECDDPARRFHNCLAIAQRELQATPRKTFYSIMTKN
jgi:hypothetical protein